MSYDGEERWLQGGEKVGPRESWPGLQRNCHLGFEWLEKWDELVKKEPSFSAQTFSRTTMKQWKKADNCSQVPNKNQTWNSETPVKLTK